MSYYMCDPDEALGYHERDEQRYEDSLPVCSQCGEKIRGDYYWEIMPFSMWCEACTEEWMDDHRHMVPEYDE